MPAQMSQLLAMQRDRIDKLESQYAKVYERYERQIALTQDLKKQLSMVGAGPQSGQDVDQIAKMHDAEQWKARCTALEQQLKQMSEQFSQQLVTAQT